MKHTLTKLPTRYWSTILLALVTAFIFGRLNYGTLLLNAVPWGILVLLVTTWLGTGKGVALRLGAVFGFLVSYAYLWINNQNIHSVTQVLILLPNLLNNIILVYNM
ncbi:hypothetical protein SAMN05444673_0969 [Bacillus sp. OV166]|nr:hypothetical protein SAMN05444673_0969 [Bacillus sp. OV166]